MTKARSLWIVGIAALSLTISSCDDAPTIPTTPVAIAFLDQPGNTQVNAPLGTVSVAFLTSQNVVAANATGSVTLSLVTTDASAHLVGTVTVDAITGLATFTALSVDKAGTGYRLQATSEGFTAVQSNTFNITP